MPLSIKRGDIWIVNFDPIEGREQKGQRPAVVLSCDAMDPSILELAYVMPATSKARVNARGVLVPNHFKVEPGPENGLELATYFMGEQLRSVSIRRFKSKLGKLSPSQLLQLEDILIMLLDFGPK
jgi:mRNA interferase MazF